MAPIRALHYSRRMSPRLAPPTLLLLTLFSAGTVAAQGRYVPQGAAQRHYQEGERFTEQGDALRQEGEEPGAMAKYEAAVEAFEEALDDDPAYIDAYARLGRVYYSLGAYQKALGPLETALRREKGSHELTFWYGQNLIGAGRGEEGLRRLERVAAETDRFPEVYVVLGNQYYSGRDYVRARPAFEQYLRLEPDANAARAKLGNTYFKLRDYRKALSEFEAVRLQWPDNVLVVVNIGNCHYQLGEYEKAVELLQEALRRDPKRQSVLFNLAQSYFQLERQEEALRYYRQFLEFKPQSFNGHYFAGSSLMKLGRDPEALAELAEAHRLQPKIVHPLYKMGLIHLRAQRTDQAEPHLRRALTLKPGAPWVLSALGTLERQRGRYDDSVRLLQQAIDAQPDAARLHANLAVTQLEAGRVAAAMTAATKALELDSRDQWIRAAAGSVLAAEAARRAGASDLAGAETALGRALELRAGDVTLLANRALVRVEMGSDEALEDARSAARASPTSALARYALGRALFAAGDVTAARDEFTAAYAVRPDASVAASRGGALLRLGEVAAAIDGLETARKAHPDARALRVNRAVAHYMRAAPRVAKGGSGGQDARDLKVTLAAGADLDLPTAARANYAALVVALRRGEGGDARQALNTLSGHAAELRKTGVASFLTPKAPTRHIDFLQACTNAQLKRYERAYEVLTPLRAARRKGSPEAKLLRWLYERLGQASFKAGRRKEAAKHFAAARSLGGDEVVANNLLAARWPARGQRYEKRWSELSRSVKDALFNYAVALDHAGRHKEAWSAYRRYARGGGAHAEKAREVADAKARIFGFSE